MSQPPEADGLVTLNTTTCAKVPNTGHSTYRQTAAAKVHLGTAIHTTHITDIFNRQNHHRIQGICWFFQTVIILKCRIQRNSQLKTDVDYLGNKPIRIDQINN